MKGVRKSRKTKSKVQKKASNEEARMVGVIEEKMDQFDSIHSKKMKDIFQLFVIAV